MAEESAGLVQGAPLAAAIRPFRWGADDEHIAPILPEALEPWPWSRAFLAEDARTGRLLGAGLMVADETAPRVLLRSVPADDGVEARLVETMLGIARQMLVPGIRAWSILNPEEPEAACWRDRGFRFTDATLIYEVGLADYADSLTPYHARLVRQGRMPQDIETLSLADVSHREIAALRVAAIGGDVARFEQQLRPPEEGGLFNYGASTVLCRAGQVVAICLMQDMGAGVLLIDSIAVAPAWRNGWANILVRLKGAERAASCGCQHIRFAADPKHKDTRKAALRSGARVVERRVIAFRAAHDDGAGAAAS